MFWLEYAIALDIPAKHDILTHIWTFQVVLLYIKGMDCVDTAM